MATGNIGTAATTTTTAAPFSPNVWSKQVEAAAHNFVVCKGLIQWHPKGEFSPGQDGFNTAYLPKTAAMTAQTAADNTATVFDYTTDTSTTVTGDKKYVGRIIPDAVMSRVNSAMMTAYQEGFGNTLAEKFDTDVLALYSGLSQAIGGQGTNIDGPLFKLAIQTLQVAKAPRPYFFVFHPEQYGQFFSIQEFVSAQHRGPDQSLMVNGGEALMQAYIGQVLGVQCFMSTLVASSSGRHNVMFSRAAFAGVEWEGFKTENDRTLTYAGGTNMVVSSWDYGVAEHMDAYAVDVTT